MSRYGQIFTGGKTRGQYLVRQCRQSSRFNTYYRTSRYVSSRNHCGSFYVHSPLGGTDRGGLLSTVPPGKRDRKMGYVTDTEIFVEASAEGSVRCERCRAIVDWKQPSTLIREPSGRVRVTKCSGCCERLADTDRIFVEVVAALVDVFGIDRTRHEIELALTQAAPLPKVKQ